MHIGIRNCASMAPIPVRGTGMGGILAQFRIPKCIFNREPFYKRSCMYGTTLAAPHLNENIVYIFLFIPYTATYLI